MSLAYSVVGTIMPKCKLTGQGRAGDDDVACSRLLDGGIFCRGLLIF